jgi:gluconolactonase
MKSEVDTPQLTLATSVGFTEGPAYSADGSLYFTDQVNNRIMRLPKGAGLFGVETYRQPAGRANGMAFDLQGRLLACEGNGEGGGRRVTRTELDGSLTVLADSYQGKRLNSPNDVTIDASGRVYFTDPRYGDRSDMELDHESVYRIDPDGTLTRITYDVDRPNGLAISADQKTLYIVDNNNSVPGVARPIWAYQLRSDGSVGSRRVVHDFGSGRGGDGMRLDVEGNLYIAAGLNIAAPPAEDDSVPAGVYIFTSAGKQIGFIPVPLDYSTNLTWGDSDLKTLYITAGASVFTVRMNVRGHVLWPSASQAASGR